MAFLGSWFFQLQVWGIWGKTKLHPAIYHPFALWPSRLPSIQLSESLYIYFMYNIQGFGYCCSIKTVLLLHFPKNLIHIFYANVNWKISVNIDSQGWISEDDCQPVSEWQALSRSVGRGSPWTARQEGSENMPSVLRFWDPMEALYSSESTLSPLGNPWCGLGDPSILIDSFLADSRATPPQPLGTLTKYPLYLGTLSIWNVVLNQKMCGKMLLS